MGQVDQRVVFINGGFGVGKSSVLDHLGDLMADHGTPFSLFDVDWFHRSWPPAAGDAANVTVEAANLAAVWSNYQKAGPRVPIVAGVLRTSEDRNRYAQAFDLPIWSVRLRATPQVTEERLRGRYDETRDAALQWHLDRHRAVAEELEVADLDDLVIDTDHVHPRQVARSIAQGAGLLP